MANAPAQTLCDGWQIEDRLGRMQWIWAYGPSDDEIQVLLDRAYDDFYKNEVAKNIADGKHPMQGIPMHPHPRWLEMFGPFFEDGPVVGTPPPL